MVIVIDGETVLNIDLAYDARRIDICDSNHFIQISLSPGGRMSELRTEDTIYSII